MKCEIDLVGQEGVLYSVAWAPGMVIWFLCFIIVVPGWGARGMGSGYGYMDCVSHRSSARMGCSAQWRSRSLRVWVIWIASVIVVVPGGCVLLSGVVVVFGYGLYGLRVSS